MDTLLLDGQAFLDGVKSMKDTLDITKQEMELLNHHVLTVEKISAESALQHLASLEANDELRRSLDKAFDEKEGLKDSLDKTTKENEGLKEHVLTLEREKQDISEECTLVKCIVLQMDDSLQDVLKQMDIPSINVVDDASEFKRQVTEYFQRVAATNVRLDLSIGLRELQKRRLDETIEENEGMKRRLDETIEENEGLKRRLEEAGHQNRGLKRRLDEAHDEAIETFSKQFNAVAKSTKRKLLSMKKLSTDEEAAVICIFEESFVFTNQDEDFVLRSEISAWAKATVGLTPDQVKKVVESKYIPSGLKVCSKRIRHKDTPPDKRPPSALIYKGLKRIGEVSSSSSSSSSSSVVVVDDDVDNEEEEDDDATAAMSGNEEE
jgi:predicted nuclease with TOPRIM domain